MKYYITLCVFSFTLTLSYAQVSPESNLGAWYMFDGNHKISQKFSIKTGAQIRSYEVTDHINLLFLYTGINYHLSKSMTLTASYCYLDIDKTYANSGGNHLFENRIYEQISYKHKLINLPIYHRLRLEHRFFNYNGVNTTKHQLRYRLGTKIPLNKTFFINVNNEFYTYFEHQEHKENRLYAALGFKVSRSNNVQLGYLNHKLKGYDLHRLQIGVFIKTDLTKKKK